jgi:hypothetical protein
MAVLDKTASRRRWADATALMCDWDPIGVMGDPTWPRDEYDCMIGPVLRLLERDASVDELQAYLGKELTEHFGLTSIPSSERRISETLKKWFLDNWREFHPVTTQD